MVLDKGVGFIGAGQMAEALARGFINKGVIAAGNVHATDIAKARRDLFESIGAHSYEQNVQVRTVLDGQPFKTRVAWRPHFLLSTGTRKSPAYLHFALLNRPQSSARVFQVAEKSDVIFIAVKPQYVSVVLNEIKGAVKKDTIIVSIAAGVPLSAMKVRFLLSKSNSVPLRAPCSCVDPSKRQYCFLSVKGRLLYGLQDAVGNSVKLIRVMPNTPCLVGETASAMCLGGSATEDDAEIVRTLFSAVGTIFKVCSTVEQPHEHKLHQTVQASCNTRTHSVASSLLQV